MSANEAVTSLKSNKASMKLNAGQTAAGKAIIKTISMPTLSETAEAADILAVKKAYDPCLAYPVTSIEHTVTTIIEDA